MDRSVCGVVIGRFQPLHHGHEALLKHLLDHADTAIVLLGSWNSASSLRNPWSAEARAQWIYRLFPDDHDRLLCVGMGDNFYLHDAWVGSAQEAVKEAYRFLRGKRLASDAVTLFGHDKDLSSSYLHDFDPWLLEAVSYVAPWNGTESREAWLAGDEAAWHRTVPPAVAACMMPLRESQERDGPRLLEDWEVRNAHRRLFSGLPYPWIGVTVDALVTASGHVLCVRRGCAPGKDLWALPGGYLNPDESLLQACWRELREETGLDLATIAPDADSSPHVCDAPGRSSLGRVISQVFGWSLPQDPLATERLAVAGADDAKDAQWLPLEGIEKTVLFEDHADILLAAGLGTHWKPWKILPPHTSYESR